MKLIATTVIRNSAIGLETINGRIVEIDWSQKRVLRQMPVPLPKHPLSDSNPRGGLRGGRGVKRWENNYYIANYDSVFVYDQNWVLRFEISHPLSVDIHEIDVDEEGVWLSCSKYDFILKLSREGELLRKWHITDSPALMRRLSITGSPIDYARDYRRLAPSGMDKTHLNCVQIDAPGKVLVHLGHVYPESIWRKAIRKLIAAPGPRAQNFSPTKRRLYESLLGAKSYIIEVDLDAPEHCKIIAEYPALRPNHNGQRLSTERFIILAESHKVVTCLASTPTTWNSVPLEGTWFRGLAKVGEATVIIGIAPCAIVEVDLAEGRVIKKLQLSDDPNEAVHGLAIVG